MAPRNRTSPGCANCRSRRIKCNLLRPRCSQCARAGLHCTGYRSKTDVFRDQTKSTAQKCGHPKTKKSSSKCDSLGIIGIVPADIEMVSKQIFFDHFPIMGEMCKRTMKSTMSQSSAAATGIISVGLIALATVDNDPQIMQLARVKYETVLQQLTKAILQPWDAPIQYSIGASYFLSIFEMFSNDDNSTPYLWLKHIDGTIAFLQSSMSHRGMHMPPMNEALNICFTKASACLINNQRVPQFLTEAIGLYEALPSLSLDEADLLPATKLFPIFSSIVNLYLSRQQNVIPYDEVVGSAFMNDLLLQDWADCFLRSSDHDSPRNSRGNNMSWFSRMKNYYRLGRLITSLLIDNGFSSAYLDCCMGPHDVQPGPLLLPGLESRTVSIVEDEIYSSLVSMLRHNLPSSGIYLSANLYFAIIMLQSLSHLTGKGTVLQKLDRISWEDKEAATKKILMRHL